MHPRSFRLIIGVFQKNLKFPSSVPFLTPFPRTPLHGFPFLLLSFDINISGMRNIFCFRFNLWNTSNAAAVLSVREGWGERS